MKKIPCSFNASTGRFTHAELPPSAVRVDYGPTEITVYEPGDVLPPVAPGFEKNTITPRQFRQALTGLSAATRQNFQTQFATLSQDDKDWWEYETEYERTAPQVGRLATKMGTSNAQLDALWIAAAKL